jgi:bla regulator protein blaR1
VETLYRAGLNNAVSATVLALLVACVGRIFGRRPAVLHCLWLLVLLKLVTPPLYEVSVPWPEPLRAAQELAAVPELVLLEREPETVGTPKSDDVIVDQIAGAAGLGLPGDWELVGSWKGAWSGIDWMRLASLLWITGAVTTLIVSIGRIRRFQRLLREAQRADDETQDWVDELAASVGLDRPPSVWWIDGKLSPMVWSLGWRSRLILPTELWKGLDNHQRATLIIHELAHLRRGDHRLRFFELLVTALYWWHPVLWWARKALRDVEEQCCDAWVVWALPDAAKSYAETLLETLDFLNQSDLAEPLLASGFGKVRHLRKRLTMIMSVKTPRLLGVWGTLGSLALAVALLPVNATWAQKPEEQKEIQIVVDSVDDVLVSSDSDATVVADDSEEATEVVAAVEAVEPTQVNVIVKSDDSPTVIAKGPLDAAVKKLTDQIKELAKKSPQSDRDKARQKALERAVRELKSTAGKLKDVNVVGDKLKLENDLRATVVRRVEDSKEITAEQKAKIEQARARVEELTRALQSKQKELMEARSTLMRLTNPRIAVVRANPAIEKRVIRLKDLPVITTTKPATVERRVTVRRDAEISQKRLEELEKKLEKVLDEVASLKKDRAK